MASDTPQSPSPTRRLFRASLAVVLCATGVVILLFVHDDTFAFPVLVIASALSLPARTTQPEAVSGKHVAVFLIVLSLVLLAAVLPASFWSWLTDRVAYGGPPGQSRMPLCARVFVAALYVPTILVRAFKTVHRAQAVVGPAR
jgi:hypothetical protein